MSKLTGITDLNPTATVLKETASVIPFLIKTAVVFGIGWYLYSSYTNRFIKLKENSNYSPSNVTDAQAKGRADTIIGSLGWFSNSFETVRDQLAGLNYNGFIKVYNAFGHQSGTLFAGDLNLVEWIRNQFSDEEVALLSSLQNGVFFKNTPIKVTALHSFINQFEPNEKDAIVNLIFS